MAGHTPGPWRYSTEDNGIYLDEDGECGPQIATIMSENCENDIQIRSDGFLIAAAPDLLEALQALLDWGRDHTSPTDANSPHELLVKADAAIAKATEPSLVPSA